MRDRELAEKAQEMEEAFEDHQRRFESLLVLLSSEFALSHDALAGLNDVDSTVFEKCLHQVCILPHSGMLIHSRVHRHVAASHINVCCNSYDRPVRHVRNLECQTVMPES